MEASWTSTVNPFCFETTKQFNQVENRNAGRALQVRLDFRSRYTDWSLLHRPGVNITLCSSTFQAETVQWRATVSEWTNAPSQGRGVAELWPCWKSRSRGSSWTTLAPNKNTGEGFEQQSGLEHRTVVQDLGNWSQTSTSPGSHVLLSLSFSLSAPHLQNRGNSGCLTQTKLWEWNHKGEWSTLMLGSVKNGSPCNRSLCLPKEIFEVVEPCYRSLLKNEHMLNPWARGCM